MKNLSDTPVNEMSKEQLEEMAIECLNTNPF